MHAHLLIRAIPALVIVLLSGAAGLAAGPTNGPGALIQEFCLDTGAEAEKALAALGARQQPGEPVREEKFGKASVHHATLIDATRVELTISHDDNAVMSCTIHAAVADAKATFADLQKRYRMKGVLADYMLGKPTRDVPFVSQVAGKPGRRMLGLFEFHQAEGQASAQLQAVILRDQAAAGPPPVKTSAAKPAPAKRPGVKTAAAKTNPIVTGSAAPARK